MLCAPKIAACGLPINEPVRSARRFKSLSVCCSASRRRCCSLSTSSAPIWRSVIAGQKLYACQTGPLVTLSATGIPCSEGKLCSETVSPKCCSANALKAASAWSACAPSAISRMLSPWRTCNNASWLRLRGLAHCPCFSSTSSASNGASASASRAAGRACSPCGFCTVQLTLFPCVSGNSTFLTTGAVPSPSCACLACSAPCASANTCSNPAPAFAATTAASVPSTNGAEHSLTLAASAGSSRSMAVSALNSALPRSISTTMPAPSATDSIASITLIASVPIGCSASSTPAASASLQPSPRIICNASSSTPRANCALCETTTILIISPPAIGRRPLPAFSSSASPKLRPGPDDRCCAHPDSWLALCAPAW